jgi:hypothetical protein
VHISLLAYTKEDNYTAAIALGVLVPLALIIIIVIIVRMAYKHYQENKEVKFFKRNYNGACLIRHTKGPRTCVGLYRLSEHV